MKKQFLVLLCVVTVLATLVGCAAPAAPAPTAAPAAAEPTAAPAAAEPTAAPAEPTAAPAAEPAKKKMYVEALALTNLPYFIDHRVGLEFAGKTLGADTKFLGPVDYDMTAMVNTMEQVMAENPDGMNVIGFDPALKPAIDQIVDAGTPLVTLDAEVYGSKRMTFLGTGNYNAGRVGGKMLSELIGGKGKVAILTKVGQSNLEERIQGYKDEIAQNYPDVEIVQIIDDQSDSAIGCRWPEGCPTARARSGRRRLRRGRGRRGRGDRLQGTGPGRQAQDRLHGPRRRHAEVHPGRRDRRLRGAEERADDLTTAPS